MNTLEYLNKLVKDYWLYFSFKEHWSHWQRTDKPIKKFVYDNDKKSLFAVLIDKKMEFVSWSEYFCINKAIEEINIHKAIGCHCLYADPL